MGGCSTPRPNCDPRSTKRTIGVRSSISVHRRQPRMGADVARPSRRGGRARPARRPGADRRWAPDAGQVGMAGDRAHRRHGTIAGDRRRGARRARHTARCRPRSTATSPLVVAGRHRLAYDRDSAHRTLIDGAATAAARGRWFEEACHLHELADLDGASSPRLTELAAEHGGLVTLFADHAAALAEGDEALADVAERFAGIGAIGHRQPGDGTGRRDRRGGRPNGPRPAVGRSMGRARRGLRCAGRVGAEHRRPTRSHPANARSR